MFWDAPILWLEVLDKCLLADHEPPLGFENTPEIQFASTCGPTLYLPIVLVDPNWFQEKMDYAITGAHGFGSP